MRLPDNKNGINIAHYAKLKHIGMKFRKSKGYFSFGRNKSVAVFVELQSFESFETAYRLLGELIKIRNIAVYAAETDCDIFIPSGNFVLLRGGTKNAVCGGCALPGKAVYRFRIIDGKLSGDYIHYVLKKIPYSKLYSLTSDEATITQTFFSLSTADYFAQLLALASCEADGKYNTFTMITVDKFCYPFEVGALSWEIFRSIGTENAAEEVMYPAYVHTDAREKCLYTVADVKSAAEAIKKYAEVING